MSTVVAVKKGKEIAIGADSMVSFGETRKRKRYIKEKYNKIIKLGDTLVAIVGNSIPNYLIEEFYYKNSGEYGFENKSEISRFFCDLHLVLKDEYYMNPIYSDDDEFECSNFECLVANSYGLFGVDAYRYVEEYTMFFSHGTGAKYALGAMYTLYDREDMRAEDIAKGGLKAGIEFDVNSDGPMDMETLRII